MQSHAGIDGKRVEPFANKFSVELPNLVARKLHLEHQHRASRNVDHDAGQRLVHRHVDGGVAGDARHRAKRLLYRLAERDADILSGVVVIDVEVAHGLDADVDPRMPRQQVQHMVEKADPGRDLGHAGAVKVYRNLDIGLFGLALDRGATHGLFFPWGRKRGSFNSLTEPSLLRDGSFGPNFGLW